MTTLRTILFAACVCAPLTTAACDRQPAPSTQAPDSSTARPGSGQSNQSNAGVAPPATESGQDSHGATTELGERQAGGFTIRASRDGEVTPGGEAPIDVWVEGGGGAIGAVRFWIGTADAKGSVKAKAALERDNWHTHAEVPDPLPSDSRLFVEVEIEGGEKVVADFDLRL